MGTYGHTTKKPINVEFNNNKRVIRLNFPIEFKTNLNLISMEGDSSVIENRFAGIVS